jgi:methyl-accepting chemotaxis protein
MANDSSEMDHEATTTSSVSTAVEDIHTDMQRPSTRAEDERRASGRWGEATRDGGQVDVQDAIEEYEQYALPQRKELLAC